jgi:hypothetical protein
LVLFERVSEGALGVHDVRVSPPHTGDRDVSVAGQICDDLLNGSLGDADPGGDLTQR